jgi:hypothetical protein
MKNRRKFKEFETSLDNRTRIPEPNMAYEVYGKRNVRRQRKTWRES